MIFEICEMLGGAIWSQKSAQMCQGQGWIQMGQGQNWVQKGPQKGSKGPEPKIGSKRVQIGQGQNGAQKGQGQKGPKWARAQNCAQQGAGPNGPSPFLPPIPFSRRANCTLMPASILSSWKMCKVVWASPGRQAFLTTWCDRILYALSYPLSYLQISVLLLPRTLIFWQKWQKWVGGLGTCRPPVTSRPLLRPPEPRTLQNSKHRKKPLR